MASSRGTSNGPDEVDLAVFMSAFQAINHLRLTVELSQTDRHGIAEMGVQVTAWKWGEENGDPSRSVLLSVRGGVGPRQTLTAAILQLLYLLDGRLAETEMAENRKTA